jgi:hypothetical protein
MTTNVPQDDIFESKYFYEVCQYYRHAKDDGTAGDAFERLKGFIRAQRQQGAEPVLYARSNELAEPILKERQVMLTVQNVPDDIYDAPLYRSPPQANALVAAAYRKAAETCESVASERGSGEAYGAAKVCAEEILAAIPADAEAALREVCMKVALLAVKFGAAHGSGISMNGIDSDDLQAIVNSVLGEGGK